MTDGQGRTVDFKNTIVIMTSNIGSQWIQELSANDRPEMERRVTEALRANFKPEFLNRIDETIIFQNLSPEQIVQIVEIQINKLRERLDTLNIELDLSDAALALIAEKGYDPVYGARPLKRVIQNFIENPLSMELLKGKIAAGDRVKADVQNAQIVFKSF